MARIRQAIDFANALGVTILVWCIVLSVPFAIYLAVRSQSF